MRPTVFDREAVRELAIQYDVTPARMRAWLRESVRRGLFDLKRQRLTAKGRRALRQGA